MLQWTPDEVVVTRYWVIGDMVGDMVMSHHGMFLSNWVEPKVGELDLMK